jgi:hypothetical protein
MAQLIADWLGVVPIYDALTKNDIRLNTVQKTSE